MARRPLMAECILGRAAISRGSKLRLTILLAALLTSCTGIAAGSQAILVGILSSRHCRRRLVPQPGRQVTYSQALGFRHYPEVPTRCNLSRSITSVATCGCLLSERQLRGGRSLARVGRPQRDV